MKLLTPAEVAERLEMSRSTVLRRIAGGDIQATKVGTHHRIPLNEYERYSRELMRRMAEGPPPTSRPTCPLGARFLRDRSLAERIGETVAESKAWTKLLGDHGPLWCKVGGSGVQGAVVLEFNTRLGPASCDCPPRNSGDETRWR